MDTPTSECHVCGQAFRVRFRYQVREEAGRYVYTCSARCQQRALEAPPGGCRCTVCGTAFALEFPHQVAVADGSRRYFCTPACREQGLATPAAAPEVSPRVPRRIAVFNHKGGTGKTTTAVSLAAGLAETGRRVLLIDADGQGNVGASLGIAGERTLYHVIVNGASPEDVAVPVRKNLDVITSNELLAAAELYLAGRPNRDRILRERLGDRLDAYDVVVMDCAPALSLMNQNALVYVDGVVVPVSCDYLSLVGVKQVLRTLKHVRELLRHEVRLLGVLPTFYDKRNRISRDAVEALRDHFGDRCFAPVRVNTRLREAPSAKQTIFELAPDSHGARDYMALVGALTGMIAPARPEPKAAIPVAAPPELARATVYVPPVPAALALAQGRVPRPLPGASAL